MGIHYHISYKSYTQMLILSNVTPIVLLMEWIVSIGQKYTQSYVRS